MEIVLVEKSHLEYLKKIGLLRFNAIRDLEIYNFYCEQKKVAGGMQAITKAAIKYCLSEKAIERIIYKMKSVCQS
jgi:hypothetical protein